MPPTSAAQLETPAKSPKIKNISREDVELTLINPESPNLFNPTNKKMISKEKLQFLAQLIQAMDDSAIELEKAIAQNDIERIRNISKIPLVQHAFDFFYHEFTEQKSNQHS